MRVFRHVEQVVADLGGAEGQGQERHSRSAVTAQFLSRLPGNHGRGPAEQVLQGPGQLLEHNAAAVEVLASTQVAEENRLEQVAVESERMLASNDHREEEKKGWVERAYKA